MTSNIYLDEDGIVHVESIGLQTAEEMIRVKKRVLELGKKLPGKIKLLNDLTRMTRGTAGSRKETAKAIKLDEIGKVAIFGASMVNRVVASFIIKLSGMGHRVKYFNNKEEAIKWLKS